ncbi:trimeric intracellular cation channel family protein [Draconibacterium sp. IB214405]|uniref:trimeric intracellular cation channel family protein n=1 Tax=Draconibacterium sp. IB214405 TaxID=3097352 RepID=UPI002A0C509A|nr:trimeric intracellular cation channel family protein [Draconibacterium sp. IB214405]MDX8339034.1 trimeric intracellular cation channel family protein [Draconibacterium sp. IB214405]
MNSADLSYALAIAGTVAFAVTAVLAVIPKGIDLFGACVMGIITAIGGGTIRDIVLDVPVFWATDLNYIWVALASSIAAFYGNRFMERKNVYNLMLYLDGAGASMFAVQGAEKVIGLDFAMPLGPVILGVITAIGGGLTRDVLAGRTTLLMKKELYALPMTVGASGYLIFMHWFPESGFLIGTTCALVAFAIRAAAIYWGLTTPKWMILGDKGIASKK